MPRFCPNIGLFAPLRPSSTRAPRLFIGNPLSPATSPPAPPRSPHYHACKHLKIRCFAIPTWVSNDEIIKQQSVKLYEYHLSYTHAHPSTIQFTLFGGGVTVIASIMRFQFKCARVFASWARERVIFSPASYTRFFLNKHLLVLIFWFVLGFFFASLTCESMFPIHPPCVPLPPTHTPLHPKNSPSFSQVLFQYHRLSTFSLSWKVRRCSLQEADYSPWATILITFSKVFLLYVSVCLFCGQWF